MGDLEFLPRLNVLRHLKNSRATPRSLTSFVNMEGVILDSMCDFSKKSKIDFVTYELEDSNRQGIDFLLFSVRNPDLKDNFHFREK